MDIATIYPKYLCRAICPIVAYEYHQRTGTPVEAILQFCEEGGHDCIVVGGRGLGVMEGLIFGSVSQELIERAKVSVVVVK